jgi:hypothetical protein
MTVGERQAALDQTARVVLAQLGRELSSVYPMQLTDTSGAKATTAASSAATAATSSSPAATTGVTFVGEDHGDRDVLRFTAVLAGAERGVATAGAKAAAGAGLSAGGAAARGDLAEIMYALAEPEDQPLRGLIRRVNFQPGLSPQEARPQAAELTPLATSFVLRFWSDTDRPDATPDGWCSDWQDPAQVPGAVSITLGLTPDTPGAPEQRYHLTVPLPLRQARWWAGRNTATSSSASGSGQSGATPATTPSTPTTPTTSSPSNTPSSPSGGSNGTS